METNLFFSVKSVLSAVSVTSIGGFICSRSVSNQIPHRVKMNAEKTILVADELDADLDMSNVT